MLRNETRVKSEIFKCKKNVTKCLYEIYKKKKITSILKSGFNMHRHNAPSPTGKNKGYIKLQEQIDINNNYDKNICR